MRVYVASTLSNYATVRQFIQRLAAVGIGVTYDWTQHGADLADKTIDFDRLPAIARAEAVGVEEADALVVLKPGGRGTYFEMGIARGRGIPTILVDGPDEGRPVSFEYLDSVTKVADHSSALEALLHACTRQRSNA